MSSGLPPTLVYFSAVNVDKTIIDATNEAGPDVFSVADSNWHLLFGGKYPALAYSSVDYATIRNIVFFPDFGRGIWKFRLSSGTNGINTLTKGLKIKIFSNTFANQMALSFSEGQKNTFKKIMDLQDKELKTINFSGKKLIIEKGEMNKGIYLVEIIAGSGIHSKRIINH